MTTKKEKITIIVLSALGIITLIPILIIGFVVISFSVRSDLKMYNLNNAANQRAEELERVFEGFVYQTPEVSPTVHGDSLTAGDPEESATAKMFFKQNGNFGSLYELFSSQITQKGYSAYQGQKGPYYSSQHWAGDNNYILFKFMGDDNESIIIKFAMDDNTVCVSNNRCNYLPNYDRIKEYRTIKQMESIPINNIIVTQAHNSSYYASLEQLKS